MHRFRPRIPMRRTTLAILSLCALALVLVVAGCGGKKGGSSMGSTGGSEGVEASKEGGGEAAAAKCTPSTMETHTPGTLTVATDDPAYPPHFEENEHANTQG